MKKCTACSIQVDTQKENCPLCYTQLTKQDSSADIQHYPDLSGEIQQKDTLLRILILISLTIGIVSVAINLLTPVKYPWSLVVIMCMLYVWIALGAAIYRRHKIGFNLMIQLISVGLILLFLASIFDFKWSVYNVVYPALAISSMLSFNVLAIVKRNELSSFLIYYLITSVLGFVPVILLFAGKTTYRWPAVTAAVYSVISILSVFVLAHRQTKTELKKRLHF